eukprot:940001-Prymnesium_polylepis.1
MSCTSGRSCVECSSLGAATQAQCYAEGCDCFGTHVTGEQQCIDGAAAAKAAYSCARMNDPILAQTGEMITLTAFDFDGGPNGTYVERLTVPACDYWKTPLNPASDNIITSTVAVDEQSRTFTSTAVSVAGDIVSAISPKFLSDEQASRGVQFFFSPKSGYWDHIDATFSITSLDGDCTGSNLYFAGDSALCAPPPPSPP